MNEHLQTLFDRAFEYARANGCSNRAVVEKFAELIVRECAEVCESMPLLGPYKEVQDATLKDAAVQIKEHFGVQSARENN